MACKVVNVCGKRRRICWGANGKIRSNSAVGKGGHSKRARAHGPSKCRKANGQIKRGCRLTKGGRLVHA